MLLWGYVELFSLWVQYARFVLSCCWLKAMSGKRMVLWVALLLLTYEIGFPEAEPENSRRIGRVRFGISVCAAPRDV